MQQLQASRDDLVEAIRQQINGLLQNEIYTDTLWTLLQLEYLISNLYIKEE